MTGPEGPPERGQVGGGMGSHQEVGDPEALSGLQRHPLDGKAHEFIEEDRGLQPGLEGRDRQCGCPNHQRPPALFHPHPLDQHGESAHVITVLMGEQDLVDVVRTKAHAQIGATDSHATIHEHQRPAIR
jgi:hypothetical protein